MSIKIENLTHIYMPKSPFEKVAIDNVSLDIRDGEFVALIGHTGSGKSTLIQHFNGLLEATSGKIIIDGIDITDKKAKLINIRKKVGLVFQYPEYQIFEETIAKDIEFGPRNLGLSDEEIHNRVIEAMEMVGLDYETDKDKSPFDLSGGQKRRVAIAGVIAMKPTTLILDEPTAGLDPKGRDDILNQISKLHNDYNMTIVIVSHSMEDVAKYVERIIVMNRGEILFDDVPKTVFREYKKLEEVGLAAPQITYIMNRINKEVCPVDIDAATVEDARDEILRAMRFWHD